MAAMISASSIPRPPRGRCAMGRRPARPTPAHSSSAIRALSRSSAIGTATGATTSARSIRRRQPGRCGSGPRPAWPMAERSSSAAALAGRRRLERRRQGRHRHLQSHDARMDAAEHRFGGRGDAGKFRFGPTGLAVTGDWNGDGRDGIGVFESGTTRWSLRQTASGGNANAGVFRFGTRGTLPVSGVFTAPLMPQGAITSLVLPPIDLDLLGVQVETSPITVTISAKSGTASCWAICSRPSTRWLISTAQQRRQQRPQIDRQSAQLCNAER